MPHVTGRAKANPMTAMAVENGDDLVPAATATPTSAAVRAVACAFALIALLLLGVVTLIGSAEWWRGLAAATVVTLMASIATIPIIAFAMRVAPTRPDLAGGAFLAAAGVRAGIALGAALLAVRQGGYPKTPTLLLLVPYYFALLFAETYVLARLLWKSGPAKADDATKTEPNHD